MLNSHNIEVALGPINFKAKIAPKPWSMNNSLIVNRKSPNTRKGRGPKKSIYLFLIKSLLINSKPINTIQTLWESIVKARMKTTNNSNLTKKRNLFLPIIPPQKDKLLNSTKSLIKISIPNRLHRRLIQLLKKDHF